MPHFSSQPEPARQGAPEMSLGLEMPCVIKKRCAEPSIEVCCEGMVILGGLGVEVQRHRRSGIMYYEKVMR